MSSRSRYRVRRSRTVDSSTDHSSHGSVPRDPPISSQALLPTTEGASSVPSVSSSTGVASTWRQGIGCRSPTKCVAERRVESRQKLNVTVVGGYNIGEPGASFVTRMGTVLRMHCKLWQRNLSKLSEETKNVIFRDLEADYQWDRTPQADNEILQHMTAMLKDWRGILKKRHYMDKTFEEAITSVPPGVHPSDWRTCCEKWNTREERDIAECNSQNHSHQIMTYRRGHTSIYQLKDDFTHRRELDCIDVFKMGRCKYLLDDTEQWVDGEGSSHYELMTQMTTSDLKSDAHTTPVTAKDAFIAVMGGGMAGRVETLGRGDGSYSGGYHPQVQQLQHLQQQLQDQNKRMEELIAERNRDRQKMEAMRMQMAQMQAFMQQLTSQTAHMPPASAHERIDDSEENDDDDE